MEAEENRVDEGLVLRLIQSDHSIKCFISLLKCMKKEKQVEA